MRVHKKITLNHWVIVMVQFLEDLWYQVEHEKVLWANEEEYATPSRIKEFSEWAQMNHIPN